MFQGCWPLSWVGPFIYGQTIVSLFLLQQEDFDFFFSALIRRMFWKFNIIYCLHVSDKMNEF